MIFLKGGQHYEGHYAKESFRRLISTSDGEGHAVDLVEWDVKFVFSICFSVNLCPGS